MNTKEIPGWEGYYAASDCGKVVSVARVLTRKNGISIAIEERILSQWKNPKTGYWCVALRKPGQRKKFAVHQLVAMAFLGPSAGRVIDHVDRDKLNNRASNLRYTTQSGNLRNLGHRLGGTSRFKGVCWDRRKGKWLAQIRIAGRNQFLGLFCDEEEAADAYDRAASRFPTANHNGHIRDDHSLAEIRKLG